MHEILKKIDIKLNLLFISMLGCLLLIYSIPGTTALFQPITAVDSFFENVSNYVAKSKLMIQIATTDEMNIHNVENDIENPFENKPDSIKQGRRNYALKGCGSLHCHGPKGRGSGGPALNLGTFKRTDGSNYGLLYIITNGIKGTRMGPYGADMPPEDILKIIAYLRWETDRIKSQ